MSFTSSKFYLFTNLSITFSPVTQGCIYKSKAWLENSLSNPQLFPLKGTSAIKEKEIRKDGRKEVRSGPDVGVWCLKEEEV